MYSLSTLKRASSFLIPWSISRSTASLNAVSCLATMVLSTIIGFPQLALEPTARNSNLFPVKAKGEVRLRSVVSRKRSGILPTTFSLRSAFSSIESSSEASSRALSTLVSCSPMKTETIAGGASLAPNRWSLLAEATEALNKGSYSHTALMVQIKKVRNCRFFIGVFPGESKLTPVSVAKDQLLCFPEPLTPTKGFSWKRTVKLCFSATFFITSISRAF